MIIYGFGSFVLLNVIAFLSLYFLSNSFFYKQQFVKNGLTETNYDYIVLGSSTGLTTLDTKQIDSISGAKGLNISMDDSGLGAHYLMLQQFYSFGNKTKELVLCVVPEDLTNQNPVIDGNDYRFLPHSCDHNVKQYFNEMNGKNKWIYQITPYIPIVGVSYFNSELFFPAIVATINPQKRNLFDEKGNFSYPIVQSASKSLENNKEVIKTVHIKNPYFIKIIDFCKTNKIQLTLYQSPIYNTKLIYMDNFKIINDASLFNDVSLFYDRIHVNRNGRAVCSTKMGEYFLNQNKQ